MHDLDRPGRGRGQQEELAHELTERRRALRERIADALCWWLNDPTQSGSPRTCPPFSKA
jgi:hypothetical protein